MNQDQQLQRALAIVEKYGMKGDVIYREIAALSDTETEPQKCEECHGTGRVEESHKVDNSGRTVEAFGCCDSCEGTGEVLTATQQAVPSQGAGELPPLPEGYPARFKCDGCNGSGYSGEMLPGNYFQPPEPINCGDCEGRGWHAEEHAYDAKEMQDYARAALLQASAQREQPAASKPPTMNDRYGDGSDHEACVSCGMCVKCGDCLCTTQSAASKPESQGCSHCLGGKIDAGGTAHDCDYPNCLVTSIRQPGEPS